MHLEKATHALARPSLALALLSAASLSAACGDDSGPEDPGPGSMPMLTTLRTATLVGDGAGGAPDATGTISIARDSAGARFVVLGSDFAQEMGPGDTQILFARSDANITEQRDADASSVSAVVGTIDNGFSGAATYEIPAGIDPASFDYLVVWCPTAEVNFGAALLGDAPTPIAVTVRSGSLVPDGAGGAPDATGTVSVVRIGTTLAIQLGDDFAQEMGPGDTQLILARTDENVMEQRNADASSVSGSLGTIPNGATGMFSFDLSSGVDLDDFDYVIVWCPTAGVNFGAAELPKRSGTLVADGTGGAPDATGSVTFGRDAAGALTVELGTDFMQEMGPGDTQIILASSDENVSVQRAADPASASISLGTVPNGSSGERSFVVPDGVEVDRFSHLVIWCPTAEVNFGVAALD